MSRVYACSDCGAKLSAGGALRSVRLEDLGWQYKPRRCPSCVAYIRLHGEPRVSRPAPPAGGAR